MTKLIQIKTGDKILANDVCKVIKRCLIEQELTTFTISAIPEYKIIEIDYNDFDMKSEKEIKKEKEVTILKAKDKDMVKDEFFHSSIEMFMDLWLKYKVERARCSFKNGWVYFEIPKGFLDQSFIDNLSGWDVETTMLWKDNYKVEGDVSLGFKER